MFTYQQYCPSTQLADYIECYWTLRSTARFIDTPDRLIPGGRVEMIFNFAAPVNWLISAGDPDGISAGDAIFMGQRNRVFYAKGTGMMYLLGVRFKPGGLAAFTNIPVSALLNSIIPAELILGTIVKEWEAQLYEQECDDHLTDVLNTVLTRALKYAPDDRLLIKLSVDTLRSGKEEMSIAWLCDQTGYGYKKLERVFIRRTGYTPKHYHKLLRFNKAVRLMHTTESLTKICYECNYYDQAHFIRDFRHFTGTTPGRFKKADNYLAEILIKHQPV